MKGSSGSDLVCMCWHWFFTHIGTQLIPKIGFFCAIECTCSQSVTVMQQGVCTQLATFNKFFIFQSSISIALTLTSITCAQLITKQLVVFAKFYLLLYLSLVQGWGAKKPQVRLMFTYLYSSSDSFLNWKIKVSFFFKQPNGSGGLLC